MRDEVPYQPEIPYQPGCETCTLLHREAVCAREKHDFSAEVDARVHARRHLRVAHGIESVSA